MFSEVPTQQEICITNRLITNADTHSLEAALNVERETGVYSEKIIRSGSEYKQVRLVNKAKLISEVKFPNGITSETEWKMLRKVKIRNGPS